MKTCRICGGSNFKEVLDMGEQPLVNSLLTEEELNIPEKVHPLLVEQCDDCSLVQVVNHVNSDEIYRDVDYLYFTGDMPQSTHDYFREYAASIMRYAGTPGVNRLVVEIGSNDGLMLSNFKEYYKILGVDPSTNVVIRALANGIPTVSDGFTKRVAASIAREFGKASLIYGNNCIAHIDDLRGVMDGVKVLLDKEGVFIVECNYWGSMVKNLNYSLIYHDHFSYFTVKDWEGLAERYGLTLFDAEVTPAQGGSLRVYMRNGKMAKTKRLRELVEMESENGVSTYEASQKFRAGVLEKAKGLGEKVKKLKAEGKTIAGYGAAAKGFSILSLAGITREIDFFVDDSPAKQGKYTPINHIPVVAREARPDPDVFIITAPNYANDIILKEDNFGGTFLLP